MTVSTTGKTSRGNYNVLVTGKSGSECAFNHGVAQRELDGMRSFAGAGAFPSLNARRVMLSLRTQRDPGLTSWANLFRPLRGLRVLSSFFLCSPVEFAGIPSGTVFTATEPNPS